MTQTPHLSLVAHRLRRCRTGWERQSKADWAYWERR